MKAGIWEDLRRYGRSNIASFGGGGRKGCGIIFLEESFLVGDDSAGGHCLDGWTRGIGRGW